MSFMLTDKTPLTEYLSEIKARLEKATPGPWHIGHVSEIADGEFSADIDGPNGEQIAASYFRANEPLLCNAPTDIAYLLSLVDRYRADRDSYAEALAVALRAGIFFGKEKVKVKADIEIILKDTEALRSEAESDLSKESNNKGEPK
jgi:hypothetical protein